MDKKDEQDVIKEIPIKDSQNQGKKKKRNKNKKRKISEINPTDEQPKKKQNTNAGSDVNKSYLDVFGANAKPELTLKLESVKKNDIKIRDVQGLVLWVLGDGVSPSWAFVKNKALISKVVVVALPGLSQTLFEKAVEKNVLSAEKGLRTVFPQSFECKAPGSNNRVYDAISVFTFKSVKTKGENSNKESKEQETAKKDDLNQYLLSPAQLNENNYPMPNALPCREYFNLTEFFKKKIAENPPADDADKKLRAIAIDCEMCITKNGFELTRVSVVNESFETLYDEYVIPDNPIMDYNTRYSGITAESLQGVTKKLKDVQQDLLKFIDHNTVLVGHSLENDLQALNIIYNKVIDTALLYPHTRGENYKNSLRFLSQRFLHADIQGQGHDSVQDAVTAMKLCKLKIENGASFGITEPDSESIFRSVSVNSNTRCVIVDNSWVCKQHMYSTVDCIATASDEETFKNVVAQVKPNHAVKFVWAQFHGLENYFQERVKLKDAPSASGDEPPVAEGLEEGEISSHSAAIKITPVNEDINEMLNDDKCQKILKAYDEYIQSVYEHLPANGMLVVLTGHGNLPKIKKMMWQKQNLHENWKDGSDELLQDEIDVCRRGLFFYKIKPAEDIKIQDNNSNDVNKEVDTASDQKMEEDPKK